VTEILLEKLLVKRTDKKLFIETTSYAIELWSQHFWTLSLGFFSEASILKASPNSEKIVMHFPRQMRSRLVSCTLFPMLALFLANPGWSKTVAPSASAQLAALAERYTDRFLELNPLDASQLTNEERYEDKFVNDLTAAHRATVVKLNTDILQSLNKIDLKKLSAADRITRDLLDYQLHTNLEEMRHDFYRTPINQFYSMPLTLVQLASTEGAQPFKTVANYEHFLSRLDGFPGWVDSAIANMREGMSKGVVQPKVLMIRTLAQLKTQIVADPTLSGFYVPVKKFPATFSEADRTRLSNAYRDMVVKKMTPAMTSLHNFISNEYLAACRDTAGLASTPNGAEKYAFLVRQNTSTKLTPEQIHAIGLSEVARIRLEMDKVKTEVGFSGDLNAFLKSLESNPALTPFKTEAEVINAFKQIQQRVEPTLDKMFAHKPRSILEIRPEPEITRLTAAAHYETGSRDGSRPGVFYAPVRDATQYNSTGMTSLFLHEAMPGHHFQLSLNLESDLSRFRRYSYFNAFGEGWALYTEGLGKDLGVFNDPYQYLGRLTAEMHRAIRLVVDTGMHAKGWTREQAIRYSLENEGGSESRAQQEVERYMAIPGQALGYKIGELKILELRRGVEKKLGVKFDIRAFHDAILNDGNLPLAVLEGKINRWLAAQ
jgi:uncharacterized protein (DUF885 family)